MAIHKAADVIGGVFLPLAASRIGRRGTPGVFLCESRRCIREAASGRDITSLQSVR
jgi:hypothetical protein